jgi:hypothetical protein
MKHKLAIAVAVTVVVVAIGSTVAWAATHGSFSRHMGSGHMQQVAGSHMGQMSSAEMRALMARVHPGIDRATLEKLAAQCQKAMNDGMTGMHDADHMGDMMGGSGSTGMMNMMSNSTAAVPGS